MYLFHKGRTLAVDLGVEVLIKLTEPGEERTSRDILTLKFKIKYIHIYTIIRIKGL